MNKREARKHIAAYIRTLDTAEQARLQHYVHVLADRETAALKQAAKLETAIKKLRQQKPEAATA